MNERTLRSIPEGVAKAINTETHAASRRNSQVHPVFAPILNAMSGPFVPDDAIDPLAPQMRNVELSAYHDEHKGWDKLEADLRK